MCMCGCGREGEGGGSSKREGARTHRHRHKRIERVEWSGVQSGESRGRGVCEGGCVCVGGWSGCTG